jgi:hypothetical protein
VLHAIIDVGETLKRVLGQMESSLAFVTLIIVVGFAVVDVEEALVEGGRQVVVCDALRTDIVQVGFAFINILDADFAVA